MHIVDTHEFYEMYRGDKDFRMGVELCNKYDIKYTALVPNISSPSDRAFFNKTKFLIDHVPELPGNMQIKLLKSTLIYFDRPDSSLGGRYFQISSQYLKQIKRIEPDIIFESIFTTLTPRSYMTFIMARVRNIPVVYLDSGDVPNKGVLQKALNKVEKHIIRKAYKIITYTELGKERILGEYGYPEQNIEVIQKPIDTEKFRPDMKSTQLREKLGASDSLIVSYVGRLSKDKGPRYLLEVAKLCKDAGEPFHFMFVGADISDTEAQKLKHFKDQHELDNVTFTGKVKHSEINQYYGASDIIVFPDIIKLTGFSTVLAESMAMGKATILGLKGHEKATPIKHMETGIVVEARNVEQIKYWLNLLKNDRELMKQLGQNARKYAEDNMDWKKQAISYMDILKGGVQK